MAIYAPDISIGRRGKSAPAPAAAAYIARARLELGAGEGRRTWDYRRVHQRERLAADLGVALPERAPAEWADRQALWAAVEAAERRADAQLYRRFMYPLPQELGEAQLVDLARRIVAREAAKGHIVDAVVHVNLDGSNPHLHMMEPMRGTDERGWLPKARTEYLCRAADGAERYMAADALKAAQAAPGGPIWEKVYKYRIGGKTAPLTRSQAVARGLDATKDRAGRAPVSRKVSTTDWDERERMDEWRADLESEINRALEAAGRPERVDRRSYAARGIERAAEAHEGPRVAALERAAEDRAAEAGEPYEPATDRRRYNLEVRRANAALAAAKARLDEALAKLEQVRERIRAWLDEREARLEAARPQRAEGYAELVRRAERAPWPEDLELLERAGEEWERMTDAQRAAADCALYLEGCSAWAMAAGARTRADRARIVLDWGDAADPVAEAVAACRLADEMRERDPRADVRELGARARRAADRAGADGLARILAEVGPGADEPSAAWAEAHDAGRRGQDGRDARARRR